MWGSPPSKYEGPWGPGTPLSVHPCPHPTTVPLPRLCAGLLGSEGQEVAGRRRMPTYTRCILSSALLLCVRGAQVGRGYLRSVMARRATRKVY